MSNQIQRRGADSLAGSYRSAVDINTRMQEAMSNCHLVAPATSVARLPEGCSVAMSVVTVDVKNDTYDVGGGKRGLSKTVLEKIGSALGVSWDPHASGRLDDASDPAYVHFKSVGYYRNFDGQVQTIVGEKEMDLRRNSPQVVALQERAKSKNATADKQIREMRLHILAHAESKAKLRALRSIGIKAAYTEQELQKPFVAAKVAFTGETDSPELRNYFAQRTADAFLGGISGLYGRPEARNPHPGLRLAAPPPVGEIPADVDDLADSGEYRASDEPTPQTQSTPEQRTEKPSAQQQQRSGDGRHAGSDVVLKFSKSKGTTIAQANTNDLEWIKGLLTKNLANDESNYPDKDRELLTHVTAELAARNNTSF